MGEGCVLPQQTYADPAALRESTETKPLFAVNVRQHKGEILPHLIVWNPGSKRKKKNHTGSKKKAKTKRIYGCSDSTNYHKFKKSVPAVSEINPFFFQKKFPGVNIPVNVQI